MEILILNKTKKIDNIDLSQVKCLVLKYLYINKDIKFFKDILDKAPLEEVILINCRIYGQYGPCKDYYHGFNGHLCIKDKIIDDDYEVFPNQYSNNKHFKTTFTTSKYVNIDEFKYTEK